MDRREFLIKAVGGGAAALAVARCAEGIGSQAVNTLEVVALEDSTVLTETSRYYQVRCDPHYPLGRFITQIGNASTGQHLEGDMVFWINDRATGEPLPGLPACDCPVRAGDRITWQCV